MAAATDDELQGQNPYFRDKLQNGVELDDILVGVFAVVREALEKGASDETFDVQILGTCSVRGKDRRDENRRGEDPGRNDAPFT